MHDGAKIISIIKYIPEAQKNTTKHIFNNYPPHTREIRKDYIYIVIYQPRFLSTQDQNKWHRSVECVTLYNMKMINYISFLNSY
jgi:hypothetical protein